MKRSILLFICTALILLCPTLALAQSPLPVTAYLYDPCGGCAGALAGCGDCMLEQALLADLTPVLEDYQATGQITLSIINILDRDNDKQYKRDLAAFDASDTVNHLPAFVVGDAETGVFLLGNESIPELPDAIDSLLLTWQGGDAPEETPPPEASEVNLPRNDSPEIVAPGDSVIL